MPLFEQVVGLVPVAVLEPALVLVAVSEPALVAVPVAAQELALAPVLVLVAVLGLLLYCRTRIYLDHFGRLAM